MQQIYVAAKVDDGESRTGWDAKLKPFSSCSGIHEIGRASPDSANRRCNSKDAASSPLTCLLEEASDCRRWVRNAQRVRILQGGSPRILVLR